MQKEMFVKKNRIFSPIKKYSWLFLMVVAFGGLWFPVLGLLLIPVMLALPVMGFLNGKYWCGTICPHGSFFDGILLPVTKNKKIPSWAKSPVTLGLAFFWFMYIFYTRTQAAFGFWGEISFYEKLGFVFVANYLAVTIIGSLLSVAISSRTWCRFCPMGTFQLLSYKLGKSLGANKNTDLKITAHDLSDCKSCMLCEKACPVQLKPISHIDQSQFDDEQCIKCSTCINHCPAQILSIEKKQNRAVS